jgi:uncharacterized protein (AIM24 family)
MAKSDSFFIRAKATSTGGSYEQIEIPMGSYVDALGKSVVRIHNIATQAYETDPTDEWGLPANSEGLVTYQLTTQTQTGIVGASDKSVVSTGAIHLVNAQPAPGLTFLSDTPDIMPQNWRNGYLIAVEELFLAVDTDAQVPTATIEIVMECTVETLSQNAAMALALSQQ